MADTRPDVIIPEDVWVDLYAASGISVGTAVMLINKGSQPVLIATSLAAPASTSIGVPLYPGPTNSVATVDAGESGLWAYAEADTAYVLVQE